jgi:hypothetical protein
VAPSRSRPAAGLFRPATRRRSRQRHRHRRGTEGHRPTHASRGSHCRDLSTPLKRDRNVRRVSVAVKRHGPVSACRVPALPSALDVLPLPAPDATPHGPMTRTRSHLRQVPTCMLHHV